MDTSARYHDTNNQDHHASRKSGQTGRLHCYCCLPLYIFCGRHLLAAQLRRSNIDASAGAEDEVARIVARMRARWPRVRILLRADSGFAREALMAWCEANRVDYLFGLARNARLEDRIVGEMMRAGAMRAASASPARCSTASPITSTSSR